VERSRNQLSTPPDVLVVVALTAVDCPDLVSAE